MPAETIQWFSLDLVNFMSTDEILQNKSVILLQKLKNKL